MTITRRFLFVMAAMAALLTAPDSRAAEPAQIQISIQGMHCAGCASKVSRRLQGVSGVASAKVDPASAFAEVTTKPNVVPSPKALWEAIERAGYKPVKLVTPGGTFTKKPQS
jgi:copper chaperone CopZ